MIWMDEKLVKIQRLEKQVEELKKMNAYLEERNEQLEEELSCYENENEPEYDWHDLD
jgi:cell division protein FtsB